ncbi:ribbon-helix-helix protein, CopG family [Methanosalsum zhilinae]|nr:ribbon-helix-helix protein, CopG family [Methanosalsum zhilinae]
MGRSYPVSARVSEDSKDYLDKLVEMGIAINRSEALKICIRYAKQNKMEDEM